MQKNGVRMMIFSLICATWIFLPAFPASAEVEANSPWPVPVNMVAMIKNDDQGRQLKFPSSVFYDGSMKEIYVITSNGRITIYGSEYGSRFFPKISLGKGRGVIRPTGLFVARDGRLFIGQGRTSDQPARLTILNAALFPLQEIGMTDIPGAEGFTPSRIALGYKGRMYIAGKGYRGVMVLDNQGEFLHWLKPEDAMLREVRRKKGGLPGDGGNTTEEVPPAGQNEAAGGRASSPRPDQKSAEMAGMPESLRPKTDRGAESKEDIRIGPVQITDVVISENGYIFLLSEETGKVYVYNSRENFIFSFGQKGGSTGKLSRPRGLAVDEDRQSVFVVDYMRHSILVYNFAGRFLFEIGGQGKSPRWFNYPSDIALTDRGYLVVADLFNQRVQVLEVVFEGGKALFGSTPE